MLLCTNVKYAVSETFSKKEWQVHTWDWCWVVCGIQEISLESPSEPGILPPQVQSFELRLCIFSLH